MAETIEAELSAGVWTDISQDVLRRVPITWSRGIFGSSPMDRVARPGLMFFALNNSAGNSGGLQGYYSPGHVNVRSGWRHGTRVRLKIDAGAGAIWYHFRGRLVSVAPTPGTTGTQEVFCTAEDWIGQFADRSDLDLTLREAVRSDQLMSDLIALVADAPANQSIDTGLDTYPFAFHDLGGATVSAVAEAQDVVQSELGMFYERGDATTGETIRFENRQARAKATTVETFAQGELRLLDGIQVPSTLDGLVNDARTVVYPSDVGVSLVVLVSLDAEVVVEPGETVVLFVDYKDPAQEAVFIGGKDVVTPAPTTDYTANDTSGGGGADITASVTVVADPFGSAAKLSVTNAALVTAYVRGPGGAIGLQMRGKALRRFAPITSNEQNATSITANGKRSLPTPLQMPYQDDPVIGRGAAAYIVNIWGNLVGVPTRIAPVTEIPSILQRAVVRDIGDRIVASEDVTGVDAVPVFINSVEGEIRLDGTIGIAWTVAPASTSTFFIFDDPVAGRFDENAFGFI